MAPKRKPTRKTTTRSTATRKTTPTRSTGRAVTIIKPQEDTSYAGMIASVRKTLKGVHCFVLDMPWEAGGMAKNLGAKHHNGLKAWLYEGRILPVQLEPYRAPDFSLNRWTEDSINGVVTPVEGVSASMKPRKHQVTAIRKIEAVCKAGYRGFVLADNVGLGKTISAIFGAYASAKIKGFTPQNKAKVLIVAPKAVLPHWRNTIKATGVNNMRIVVINYDQAKKLLDAPASASRAVKTVTKSRHTMLNGTPNIKWDIIIADESHKLKNDSQRTTAFNRIARYSSTADKAPFVIWTSATVGQNPLELGYLAPIISQINGGKVVSVDNWGDFLIANKFNVKKSKAGNFSWIKAKPEMSPSDKQWVVAQQKKDVDRLGQMLFNPKAPSLRRNPEDIAGWPSQTKIPTPIDLNPEGTRLYEQAWREFRSYIGLHPRGKNPSGGLAATLRFRQKASLLSAAETAEFANDLLDNNVQVGISVEFIESLDAIKTFLEKKGWHCAEFSGRNVDERESERLRFQRGEAQVMLFTVEEGISLHAGEQLPDGSHATNTKRALILHDIRYSAIAVTQILGRMTRDGQLANAYFMFIENTIQAMILQVMFAKMKNLHTLSGDDDSSVEEIQNLLDGLT